MILFHSRKTLFLYQKTVICPCGRFIQEKEDYYTISVVSGGETKYLNINGGISLVDKSDASLVKVTPGTNDKCR